jgi:TonB family protein
MILKAFPKGSRRWTLLPYLLLSLFIHVALLSMVSWTIEKTPTLPTVEEKKLQKKREKRPLQKEKHPIYVKILDIPKPEKEEQPKKSHIISQYSMKKKGPKGKQEISSLSGESSTLNYQPGLPITPPKPHITLVPGKRPVEVPKLAQKGKGKRETSPIHPSKKGEKRPPPAKGEASPKKRPEKSIKQKEEKKLAKLVPEEGPSTQIVPPLPKRKIPLFDPSLIREHSKKIVPQLGEGESSVISLDTTKSKYISYFKHIRDKLYLVWRYPLAARMNSVQGTARILFVIDRSGRLKEARLLQSSGFTILDNEALRAIRAAGPFGPFPSDWAEKELRIRARFIYQLFGRSPFG